MNCLNKIKKIFIKMKPKKKKKILNDSDLMSDEKIKKLNLVPKLEKDGRIWQKNQFASKEKVTTKTNNK